MKKGIILVFMSAIISGFYSCGGRGGKAVIEEQAGFQWVIDRFDDIKVLQYQVPGFDSLELEQKLLIYYLNEAALSGRDIIYDQNFKYNLPIRRTLEAIYNGYTGDRRNARFRAFERYLKKVWFANGIHHHYSTDKFTPEFNEDYFDQLVKNTPMESFPLDFGPIDSLIATVKPVIFDPELYPKRVNLNDTLDMVVNSANNYYEGVTQEEVENYYAALVEPDDRTPVSYGLNSKLMMVDSAVVEKVWKVGGMYSAAIEKIVYWLEQAAGVAAGRQKEIINTLIAYYRTGDLKTFDRYNVLWVQDTESKVDFVNGFTEVYGDPLGYKGSWEALVNFKDEEATRRTETISVSAQWFEDNSPIDAEFKKPEVKGVSAKVITAAMLGGDCYPATPIGINLPNADWIRRDYGSKSVTIQNIMHAYSEAAKGNGFDEEFILRAEDRELKKQYGSLADDLHTDLHECLGHGSGQLAPGVIGDELKNYSSTLEEARADLFALYYLADTKLVELGVIPSFDVAKTAYSSYIMNGMMTQLTLIRPGNDVEESHMRNRQIIARWCYERGLADNVIDKVSKSGKTYIVVNDFGKLRELFGQLLREVQRIKSTGDYEAGRALVETYGIKVDSKLHEEVLQRYAKLKLEPYSGFVNPVYRPIMENGEVIDVIIDKPESYISQMLEYSREYSFLPSKN